MGTAANVAANFVGRASGTLVNIVVVPMYIHLMGREGFGLVGLFTSLQVIQTLLDAGLGLELSRRMAKLLVDPGGHADEIGDLVRTFGITFTLMALVVLTAVVVGAPWVATSWVRVETLSSNDVRQALMVVGVFLALQWPSAMLNTILASAERQGIQNAIATGTSVVRAISTVAALHVVAPTPLVFAAVQVVTSVLQLVLLGGAVARLLPAPNRRTVIRWDVLRASWTTSASTLAITALQIGISQTDRILLSRTLPLAELGVYSLALTLAANLNSFITPIYAAYFPRFCRSVESDPEATRRDFLEGTRVMVSVVMAPALTLSFFAHETLYAWTGDARLASEAAGPLRALSLGFAVASLHHIPQAMQYASGWLRPQILATGAATLLGVTWFAVSAERFPLSVVALGWLGMNALILVTAAPFAAKRFAGGLDAGVVADVLWMVGAVAAAGALARLVPVAEGRTGAAVAVSCGAVAAIAGGTAALAIRPWGREFLRSVVRRARREPPQDHAKTS